jgi:hypothetical protein
VRVICLGHLSRCLFKTHVVPDSVVIIIATGMNAVGDLVPLTDVGSTRVLVSSLHPPSAYHMALMGLMGMNCLAPRSESLIEFNFRYICVPEESNKGTALWR